MTAKLPTEVRDELDRIRLEIACIRGFLASSDDLCNFQTDSKEGLTCLLDGWGQALERLSNASVPPHHDAPGLPCAVFPDAAGNAQ